MSDARTKLLDAAGPIFASKGFEPATVREICRDAEANVAAVNYYFGGKKGLYEETVIQASRRLEKQFPLPDWDDSTDATAKLRGLIRTMLARMIGDQRTPWEQQLMIREVIQPTDACRELAEQYFRPHFELLLTILAELLPEGTPRHRLRQIGFSVVGQCLYYRIGRAAIEMLTPMEERNAFTIEQLADHISTFTVSAISGASHPSSHVYESSKTRQPVQNLAEEAHR